MHEAPSFGDWLRQSRKALDLTQEALAAQVGCSRVTIRKIEGHTLRPSAQIAARLAAVLGIPVAEQAIFVQWARAVHGTRPVTRSPAAPTPGPSDALTAVAVDG